MIEYIYFVKCDGCEDEPFYFFDKAKECAMSCLNLKPIITQVEVDRNDFGECVDSCDLGTIWSWEDTVRETTADPTVSIFTKDDLKHIADAQDPEFDALDNSVDYKPEIDQISALDEVPDNFSKPLLESKWGVYFKTAAEWDEFKKLCDEIGIYTIGDVEMFMKDQDATPDNLLAKLREYRAELGPDFKIKESRKPVPEGMTIEQLVEEMEENEDMVECTWCNDLFDKSECRKEVDLGYLCSRCEAAIKSRGEKLTFVENDYWDFLDEEVELPVDSDEEESEESIFDEAKSIEDVVDILVKDEEDAISAYDEAQDKIGEFLEGEDAEAASEVLEHIKEEEIEHIEELESILAEPTEDETSEISEEEPVEESVEANGAHKDIVFFANEIDAHFDKKYKIEILDGYKIHLVDETKDMTSEINSVKNITANNLEADNEKLSDGTYVYMLKKKATATAEALAEAAVMIDCPECGAEKAFDRESGVCNNCGFIL